MLAKSAFICASAAAFGSQFPEIGNSGPAKRAIALVQPADPEICRLVEYRSHGSRTNYQVLSEGAHQNVAKAFVAALRDDCKPKRHTVRPATNARGLLEKRAEHHLSVLLRPCQSLIQPCPQFPIFLLE
jgi:hypothetical protein